MIELNGFLSITLSFFLVTVAPGPANLAVATVAMSSGRRHGLRIGAGLSVGLAVWGLGAATGLGAVLQGSARVLTAIKLFGGLYLLWLAYQSARSVVALEPYALSAAGCGRWFKRGLVLNLSNPKAVVAWTAALSMGLGAGDGQGEVIAATAVCAMLGFLNYISYALLFSLPGAMAAYRRVRRWIDGVVAGVFSLAGLGLIRSAISR